MPPLEPPTCRYCNDAGWARASATDSTLVRCHCNPAAEPVTPAAPLPAPIPIRSRRGRAYADRLES